MVFLKINVNVCILTHPINKIKIGGGGPLKTPYFTYTTVFSLYTNSPIFWLYPNVFLGAQMLSILFLHYIMFLTPLFFFGFVSNFHEGYFSPYNHELWSSHEQNRNNKPKAKACNWSIILYYNMKFKYDIEVTLCLGTWCSLCSSQPSCKVIHPSFFNIKLHLSIH